MSDKSSNNTKRGPGRPKGSFSFTYRSVDHLEGLGAKTVPVRGTWWRGVRSEVNKQSGRGRPAGSSDGHPVKIGDIKNWVSGQAEIPVLAKWVEELEAEKTEA